MGWGEVRWGGVDGVGWGEVGWVDGLGWGEVGVDGVGKNQDTQIGMVTVENE